MKAVVDVAFDVQRACGIAAVGELCRAVKFTWQRSRLEDDGAELKGLYSPYAPY